VVAQLYAENAVVRRIRDEQPAVRASEGCEDEAHRRSCAGSRTCHEPLTRGSRLVARIRPAKAGRYDWAASLRLGRIAFDDAAAGGELENRVADMRREIAGGHRDFAFVGLRQVARHVKVQCLPKDIPAEFSIDVRDLGIRQSKRMKDVELPAGVRPLASLEEVLVVIAKR